MSPLKERMQNDMKNAMRNKETLKRDVIRFVMSALKQVEVDERKELSDSEIEAIILKQIKQRNDAIHQFKLGHRDDLVKKNEEEIAILQAYLPEPLSEEELEATIKMIIAETGATSMKDMGKVMGAAKEKIGSRADGQTINAAVKALLG